MAFDNILTTDFEATIRASDWQERLPTLKLSENTLNIFFFFFKVILRFNVQQIYVKFYTAQDLFWIKLVF